jgi:hypothetical protein
MGTWMTPHCANCRWVGAAHGGLDARLARCLHPTSRRHELSCLIARSRTVWGGSKDICGELGRHWEPRDRGEAVEAPVGEPPRGRDGAEAERA